VTDEGIVVVNFAHPLTGAQREQVASLAGRPVVRVVDVPAHIDVEADVGRQATALVDRAGLSAGEWQTLPLVVNPPGLAPLAAAVLAELHGRMGYFATILRIRPMAGSAPTRYEVAELLNLQALRDAARERRG
jgi:hypothetical protein